jgi:hypothetical protein
MAGRAAGAPVSAETIVNLWGDVASNALRDGLSLREAKVALR